MMEETMDCGSISTPWFSKTIHFSDLVCLMSNVKIDDLPDPIGVFFFVREPQPDELEAMEASSLELTVCRLDTELGFVDIKLVGAWFGPTDDMTRPKSSSDGNWLIFEEGLLEQSTN